jgi:hypothetical protein
MKTKEEHAIAKAILGQRVKEDAEIKLAREAVERARRHREMIERVHPHRVRS